MTQTSMKKISPNHPHFVNRPDQEYFCNHAMGLPSSERRMSNRRTLRQKADSTKAFIHSGSGGVTASSCQISSKRSAARWAASRKMPAATATPITPEKSNGKSVKLKDRTSACNTALNHSKTLSTVNGNDKGTVLEVGPALRYQTGAWRTQAGMLFDEGKSTFRAYNYRLLFGVSYLFGAS